MAWRQHAAELKSTKRKLARMMKWKLGAAFTQWRDVYLDWIKTVPIDSLFSPRHCAKRVITSMTKLDLTAALNQWRNAAREEKQMKANLQRAVVRMTRAALASSYTTWHDTSIEMKSVHYKLAGAARKMASRALGMGFTTWREAAAEINQHKKKLAKMLKWRVGVATRTWQGARVHLVKAKWVMVRMTSRKMSAAWQQWVTITAQTKHEMVCIRRALTRMTKRAKASAYTLWRQTAEQMKTQARKVVIALKKLRNRTLAMALLKWRETAARMIDHTKKLVGTMSWKLGAAFRTWQETCCLDMTLDMTSKRVSARMLNWKVASAWRQWKAFAADTKHEKACLQRAATRMTKRALASAYSTWKQHARELKLTNRKLGGAMKKIRSRSQMMGFNGWRETAAMLKHQRQCVQAALSKWLNSALTAAMNMWRDGYMSWVTGKAAIVRITHLKLAAAFDAFRENSSYLNAARDKFHYVATRMKADKGLIWFTTWMNTYRTLKAVLENRNSNVNKAALHLVNRGLSLGMTQWRDIGQENNAKKEAMNAAVLNMKMCHIKRATSEWKLSLRKQKHEVSTMSQAMTKFAYLQRTAAWNTWLQATREATRGLELLNKSIKAHIHRTQRSYWVGLVATIHEVKQVRKRRSAKTANATQETRSQQRDITVETMYERVMTKFKMVDGSRAWKRWERSHSNALRARKMSATALLQVKSKGLTDAIRTFQAFRKSTRKNTYNMKRVINLSIRGTKWQTLTFLRKKASTRQRILKGLDSAWPKRKTRLLRRGLVGMRHVYKDSTHRIASSEKGWKTYYRAQCLSVWREWQEDSRRTEYTDPYVKTRLAWALKSLVKSKTSPSFWHWHDRSMWQLGNEARAKLAISWMMQRARTLAFLRLVAHKRRQDRLDSIFDRLDLKSMMNSLTQWDRYTMDRRFGGKSIDLALNFQRRRKVYARFFSLSRARLRRRRGKMEFLTMPELTSEIEMPLCTYKRDLSDQADALRQQVASFGCTHLEQILFDMFPKENTEQRKIVCERIHTTGPCLHKTRADCVHGMMKELVTKDSLKQMLPPV